MATIDSKNLLVWVKAMSRGQALPLDASEIHESLSAAETYAGTATAYEGQTIKAKLEDGKYHEFILQPSEAGYVLEEVGAIKASDLKQFVMVVDTLPIEKQEEGILYICGTTGSIWTDVKEGEETVKGWKNVFWDVTEELDAKAPINNPIFTGTVKVKTGENDDGEEVALKSYVEGLFAQLAETEVPGIVSKTQPIPTNYKAGKSYRVADPGEYVGKQCEVGDLILVIKDYEEGTASDDDFMVIQANIDGAVTSKESTVTSGHIVVFEGTTGKVIKSSNIAISDLQTAINNAHSHDNKTQLDSYTKTETELLNAAKDDAAKLIENKADKGTTLADYGITNAYTSGQVDELLTPIRQNLNSKVTAADVTTQISDTVGDIPANTTVKGYIDSVVEAGGTDNAEAIATAKQEAINAAKEYTDDNVCETIDVPFYTGTDVQKLADLTTAMLNVKEAIDADKKFSVKITTASGSYAGSYVVDQYETSRELRITAIEHNPTTTSMGYPVVLTASLNLANDTASCTYEKLYVDDVEGVTNTTKTKCAPSATAVRNYVNGLMQVVEF